MICDIQVGPRHVSQYYGVFYSPISLDGDMNSWSGMLCPRMRVLVFQIIEHGSRVTRVRIFLVSRRQFLFLAL